MFFYLPFMLQLLLTTDVTDMQTVPAAPPTLTGASGAMIRSAFQQAVTAAWSVSAGGPRRQLAACAQRGGFYRKIENVWCSRIILWADSSQIMTWRLINYESLVSA